MCSKVCSHYNVEFLDTEIFQHQAKNQVKMICKRDKAYDNQETEWKVAILGSLSDSLGNEIEFSDFPRYFTIF